MILHVLNSQNKYWYCTLRSNTSYLHVKKNRINIKKISYIYFTTNCSSIEISTNTVALNTKVWSKEEYNAWLISFLNLKERNQERAFNVLQVWQSNLIYAKEKKSKEKNENVIYSVNFHITFWNNANFHAL